MFDTSHIHPILVHFPIALVIIGFVADAAFLFFRKEVCLLKTGTYLLFTGTLAAMVTWLSGYIFTSVMSGPAGQVRETHELLATITVGLLIITSVVRIIVLTRKTETPGLRSLAFALYCLAALSVGATGFFGGNLVYSYMMPL